MQEVYNDGTLGKIRDLDLERLQDFLSDPNVDHVRVFNRETGGQVQVEINDLKSMITEAVGTAFEKNEIAVRYQQLIENGDQHG